MVVEVILEPILQIDGVSCYDDLITVLEERATESKTCKLWLDCLLKPVFLTKDFIRAEREGNFPLHVATLKSMHPYYFAAGRANYARSVSSYLMSIECLPVDMFKGLVESNHVMRHKKGIWNGISSDMFIESTFMRYGHSKTGVIGTTLKPETTKDWALSRHVCGKLLQDLSEIRGDRSKATQVQLAHKEETKARIEKDKKDRESIRQKLKDCIHPLDSSVHPGELVNVSSGRLSSEKVNVHMTMELSLKQANEFQKSLPEGFWSSITRQIKTMSDVKRATRLANLEQTCDPEMIYSRALALQATSRKIDTQTLLSHELSSYPLSLFDDSGEMRLCSSKAVLKTKTHVEMLGKNISSLECRVLDGYAILWVIQWPSNTGKEKAQVKDFIDSFVSFILYKMQEADIYLVFDRYLDYSTKTSTRQARGTGGCKTFQLLYASPLPTQTQVLNNSKNKKQLIALIVEKLIERLTEQDDEFQHKLVVTGQNPCPVELFNGLCIQRQDLINNHKEADAIVVSHAIYVSTVEGESVGVVADDTDIYIMLLYHYKKTSANLFSDDDSY